jgi:putative hydrolase of the HAD superfamily
MMEQKKTLIQAFDLIAFDADDTLWENENLYAQGLERFRELMRRYEVPDAYEKRQQEIEINNLQYYGYGVAGFVMSLIEAAIELTGGKISGSDLQGLVKLAKEMFSAQVVLHDHAWDTVQELAQRYPLMLITKGDLRHQHFKIDNSGLKDFFRHIEVVPDKTPETYAVLLSRLQIEPQRFVMVGDSLRSDILPVLEIGGYAVHVPSSMAWDHEKSAQVSLQHDRFFELESLALLPNLLEEIINKSNGR